MTASSPFPVDPITVADETFTRDMLMALLAHHTGTPMRFERCTFDKVDMAGLDLRGCQFDACTLFSAQLARAKLSGAQWTRCKAGTTDLTLADLTDAVFLNCDLNNTHWTRANAGQGSFWRGQADGSAFHASAGARAHRHRVTAE